MPFKLNHDRRHVRVVRDQEPENPMTHVTKAGLVHLINLPLTDRDYGGGHSIGQNGFNHRAATPG